MAGNDMPETLYVNYDYGECSASDDPEYFADADSKVRVGVYKLAGYAVVETKSVTTVTPVGEGV